MKKNIFILLYCLIVSTLNLFAGQVFYVVEGGVGDGTSWENAYGDVQTAIDAAASVATDSDSAEVWIAKGTYKHGSSMTMKNNVAIYGGFAGTETSKEERVAGNETILDGEKKCRVFFNQSLAISAKFDNVTIQNGNGDGGAGIYTYGDECIIITNCTFKNNIATYPYSPNPGGAIYCSGTSIKILNTTFVENIASIAGCIYIKNSNAIIENCTFLNNSGGNGPGCIKKDKGYYNTIDIINCTFTGNDGWTGAIEIYEGSASIKNCILWGNGRGLSGEIFRNNCSVENSIIKGGFSSGTNIITEDPKLGELGNYGGAVQTIPVLVGSSAIGAGVITEDTPTTDARGFARSTSAPTIGAYEYLPPTIMENPKSVLGTVNQDVSISISAKSALGDDNISYQWQFLNSNGEWEDIEGAAESIYTIQNCQLEQDGSKYRCVVSNAFDGLQTTSEEVVLTVCNPVSSAVLSTNRITIVNGGYAHLEVSHDAVEPSYRWYYSADTGLTWVEIENSNSSVLEFQAESSMNRRQYKCVVTDGGGTSVESDRAVLIINSNAITISQDIADATAFIGKETVLSVSAKSSATLGYQWQVSTDNGATWLDIEGATSSSLSLTPEDYELSGNLYRCKIDNGGGFIYSSNSAFTVFKNVEITAQPTDLIVWNAKNADFSVSATGDGAIKYQWQVLVGEEWREIENGASSTLILENVSVEMNGSRYRCIVSNEGTATLTSSEAILTVYKTLEITAQPKETYAFEGDGAAFSVEVDAQGDVSYQWQELILGVWTDIANEASSILEIPAMENSYDGRMFRVVVSNGGDDFISEIAALKLARPLEITSQPQNIATAYIGKTAVFKVEASGYEPQYQWYVSGNYGADTGVEIEGANSSILTLQVEDESIFENVYFCKITNAKATLTSDMVYVENIETLSAYQEWADANGLGVDAKPDAKPFNDGITNLEKYAFGLDGSAAASYAAQPLFVQTNDGETASFQYPVSKDAVAVRVKALVSEDLINWTEASATANGESGNFNLFKVEKPLPASGRLFFKVEVSED